MEVDPGTLIMMGLLTVAIIIAFGFALSWLYLTYTELQEANKEFEEVQRLKKEGKPIDKSKFATLNDKKKKQ